MGLRTLEVIATSVEDAIAAAAGGADRIEVIADPAVGGLTPPLSLVEDIMDAVSLDIQVMIRPHARSFVYTEQELSYMAGQIAAVRSLGRPGIVVGCLTDAGAVDERGLAFLLSYAQGMDVTFHRALDDSSDLLTAYEAISRFSAVRRVLTSGGATVAPDGADTIAALVRMSENSGHRPSGRGGEAPGYGIPLAGTHGSAGASFSTADGKAQRSMSDGKALPTTSKDKAQPTTSDAELLAAAGAHRWPAVMAGSGLHAGLLQAFVQATGVRELHFGTGVRGPVAVDRTKVAEVRRLLDETE